METQVKELKRENMALEGTIISLDDELDEVKGEITTTKKNIHNLRTNTCFDDILTLKPRF